MSDEELLAELQSLIAETGELIGEREDDERSGAASESEGGDDEPRRSKRVSEGSKSKKKKRLHKKRPETMADRLAANNHSHKVTQFAESLLNTSSVGFDQRIVDDFSDDLLEALDILIYNPNRHLDETESGDEDGYEIESDSDGYDSSVNGEFEGDDEEGTRQINSDEDEASHIIEDEFIANELRQESLKKRRGSFRGKPPATTTSPSNSQNPDSGAEPAEPTENDIFLIPPLEDHPLVSPEAGAEAVIMLHQSPEDIQQVREEGQSYDELLIQCRKLVRIRIHQLLVRIAEMKKQNKINTPLGIYFRKLSATTLGKVARSYILFETFLHWPKSDEEQKEVENFRFEKMKWSARIEDRKVIEMAIQQFAVFLCHKYPAKIPVSRFRKLEAKGTKLINDKYCIMENITVSGICHTLICAMRIFGVVPVDLDYRELKLKGLKDVLNAKTNEEGNNRPYKKFPVRYASLTVALYHLNKSTPSNMKDLRDLSFITATAATGVRASSLLATQSKATLNTGMLMKDVKFDIKTPPNYFKDGIKRYRDSLSTPATAAESSEEPVNPFNDTEMQVDSEDLLFVEPEPWNSNDSIQAQKAGFLTFSDIEVNVALTIRKEKGSRDILFSRTEHKSSKNANSPINFPHATLLHCFISGFFEENSIAEIFYKSSATVKNKFLASPIYYHFDAHVDTPNIHTPLARDESVYAKFADILKLPRNYFTGRAQRQGFALSVAVHFKSQNPSATFEDLVSHVRKMGNWKSAVAERYLGDLGLHAESDFVVSGGNKNATSAVMEFEKRIRRRDPLSIVMLPAYREKIDKIRDLIARKGIEQLSVYAWYRDEKERRVGKCERETLKALAPFVKQYKGYFNAETLEKFAQGCIEIKEFQNFFNAAPRNRIKCEKDGLLAQLKELVEARKSYTDFQRTQLKNLLDAHTLKTYLAFEEKTERADLSSAKTYLLRYNIAQVGLGLQQRHVKPEGSSRGYSFSFAGDAVELCPIIGCLAKFVDQRPEDILKHGAQLALKDNLKRKDDIEFPKSALDPHLKRAHGEKGKRAGLYTMPKSGYTCKSCYPPASNEEGDGMEVDITKGPGFEKDWKCSTEGITSNGLKDHIKKKHWKDYLVCYACDMMMVDLKTEDADEEMPLPVLRSQFDEPSLIDIDHDGFANTEWNCKPGLVGEGHGRGIAAHKPYICRRHAWKYFTFPIVKLSPSFAVAEDCPSCDSMACRSLHPEYVMYGNIDFIKSSYRNHPLLSLWKRAHPRERIPQPSPTEILQYALKMLYDKSGITNTNDPLYRCCSNRLAVAFGFENLVRR